LVRSVSLPFGPQCATLWSELSRGAYRPWLRSAAAGKHDPLQHAQAPLPRVPSTATDRLPRRVMVCDTIPSFHLFFYGLIDLNVLFNLNNHAAGDTNVQE
jgi:hypothetical protein